MATLLGCYEALEVARAPSLAQLAQRLLLPKGLRLRDNVATKKHALILGLAHTGGSWPLKARSL